MSANQTAETSLVSAVVPQERRSYPRFDTRTSMLACLFGPEYLEYEEEVKTTSNWSPNGLYFESRSTHYRVGMPLSVTVGYSRDDEAELPMFAKVVRIDQLEDASFGIAIRILTPNGLSVPFENGIEQQ